MPSNDELWGMFAVDGRLCEHAFVAELILFDRLVLPQPADDDTDEFRRWTEFGWRPDDLRQMVDRLEEFAIPVPWGNQLRSMWKTEYGSVSPDERSAFRISEAGTKPAPYAYVRLSRAETCGDG